jgi:hypothetical protein
MNELKPYEKEWAKSMAKFGHDGDRIEGKSEQITVKEIMFNPQNMCKIGLWITILVAAGWIGLLLIGMALKG